LFLFLPVEFLVSCARLNWPQLFSPC